MDKVLRVLILSAALMLICSGCYRPRPLASEFDRESLEADALEMIRYFNEGQYGEIISRGNAVFQKNMTTDQFKASVDKYVSDLGNFESIERLEISGQKDIYGDDLALIVAVGNYTQGKLIFLIGFNTDMELMQFFIQ